MSARIARLSTRLTLLALALMLAAAPLLFGGDAADAKRKKNNKPVDLIVQSITISAETADNHFPVLVKLRNKGKKPVGPFTVVMTADRNGAARPPATSLPVSLGPNQTQIVTFADLGCKWLNGANNATITATTDPAPVPGETGTANNNTLTTSPNLSFPGEPGCI